MKASDCMIKCLENEWVEYIFGIPGEENLDLLQSLSHSTIRLILTRNEQTAVFMAATYGRLTGKAGVALATLGPGATNMLTGVAHAQLGAMPVIVITGQKPIKSSKQWLFQIIDVWAMMTPITKRSTSIIHGSRIPTIVRQAFKTAEAERPGVVHIELAEDIAGEEINDSHKPLMIFPIRRPQIDEKMLQQLVHLMCQAQCPMFLIGAGANRKRITKYLTKLIQKTGIPFLTSQMGKWVIDESLPQYIGTASLSSQDYIHDITRQADLIVAIGYDPIEKPAMFLDYSFQKLIHINFFQAVTDEVYQPSLEVIWDIANTCRQLFESDLDSTYRDYTSIIPQIQNLHRKIAQQDDSNISVMWPHKLVRDLRSVLWPDDILTLDNWLYKLWIARNYPAYKPNTVLLDNALATMGAWYSIAMTAKLLHPWVHVVSVVWDWGLMMNLWDLETIVRLWLDIVIVIIHDNAYGMIKWKQQAMKFNDFGLDFHNPDFVLLAQSMWATGIHLTDPQNFSSILKQAVDTPGLVIIDVPFIYPSQIA